MQESATIGRDPGTSRRRRRPFGLRRPVGLLAVLAVLVAGLSVVAGSPPAGAAGGSLSGPIGGGFWGSFGAKVGANGSAVAYTTVMRNFNPAWPVDRLVVYLRDRTISGSAANIPVVRPLAGALPNGNSFALGVSPDPGTSYVLFRSTASNLVAGDTLGHEDIFLFNRAGATTERVSVGAGGVQGNGPVQSASMSGNTTDGNPRYVVFTSAASNLVAGDGNGFVDVFLRDRVAGTTTRLSAGPGGVAANGDSFNAVVSDNGRFVAYASAASNLVAGDTNNASDVFVLDRQTATTERVSVGFAGEGTGSSTAPQISADGRFVAFDSSADDLVPDDDNISYDVFVRDRTNASTERVSLGPNGEQGEWDSESPSMSRDGRYIAFDSEAEEFHANDGNISIDVYVRDRLARTTERASEKGNGFEAFGDSSGAAISPDGRYAGFETDSGEFFESTDLNDDYDIYLKDMAAPFFNNSTVGSRFTPVATKRLLDTTAGAQLTAGTTLNVQAAGGTTTVPASARAVLVNVITTGETTGGAELNVFPAGAARPKTVSLHPQVGSTVSNQLAVKVGTGGAISLWTNTGATDVVVDVVGYYAPNTGDAYTPVTAPPIVDTRSKVVPPGWPIRQPMQPGGALAQMNVNVSGLETVSGGARAVALSVTAMSPSTGATTLTAFPAGTPKPTTAQVYAQTGNYVTNRIVVPVGVNGDVSLAITGGSAHVLVSIAGYYGAFSDSLYFPMTQSRVLDTRSTSAALAIPGLTGPVPPLQTVSFSPLNRGGVPANAKAVAVTMSSAGATLAPGVLLAWPTGDAMPAGSHLNYKVGTNASNSLVPSVGTGGAVSFMNYSLTSVHLFADATGYFR